MVTFVSSISPSNHPLSLQIRETLRPLAEEWSGTRLQYSTIYGIRRYLDGGYIDGHVDKQGTCVYPSQAYTTKHCQ